MSSVVITEMPWRKIAITSSKRFGNGLSGFVGVRELVDQRDVRVTAHDRFAVQLAGG